jgi:hypothetical protein
MVRAGLRRLVGIRIMQEWQQRFEVCALIIADGHVAVARTDGHARGHV